MDINKEKYRQRYDSELQKIGNLEYLKYRENI